MISRNIYVDNLLAAVEKRLTIKKPDIDTSFSPQEKNPSPSTQHNFPPFKINLPICDYKFN